MIQIYKNKLEDGAKIHFFSLGFGSSNVDTSQHSATSINSLISRTIDVETFTQIVFLDKISKHRMCCEAG